MEDINLIYESTSDDDTSCEENKDKVKLIRKSSSKYKILKNKSEPPPLNRLQKLFNERRNIIKPVQQPEESEQSKQQQKQHVQQSKEPIQHTKQPIQHKPVIQSIAQPPKNNINNSTLMLIRSKR
jgi:hypothetical protein